MTTIVTTDRNGRHLHSLETTLVGAFVLGVLFVMCWVTAAYGKIVVPGAFVRLFTRHPVDSISALYEGVLWAVLFGAIIGALIALSNHFIPREK